MPDSETTRRNLIWGCGLFALFLVVLACIEAVAAIYLAVD